MSHATTPHSTGTVGLIGLGAIGLRFARMADAMGMRAIPQEGGINRIASFTAFWV